MWGRLIEIILGLWLTISPFIFGHYPENRPLWINDLICGPTIVLLALLSFWSISVGRFLRYAHLLILAVACWLIGFGYFFGGYPASSGYQNNIILGLILLVIAIIPNDASQPPPGWRRYYQQQAESLYGSERSG
jgi:hypothetical protein